MAASAVIATSGLSKTYGSGGSQVKALDRLDLSVNQGEIFGYLGPNGAGKTTTIKLLLDLIRPTAGSAAIFGMDARENSVEIHRRVGFLPAELELWGGRRGDQVIDYVANVHGDSKRIVKHAAEIAGRLDLDTTRRVRDYSSGNKRKLGIVLAMMHAPELLILDEPTNGLDPLVQQTFHEMMLEYRDKGKTVFLSSHILSEVQAICERVGILRDGDLKAVESVDELTQVDFHWIDIRFRDKPSDSLIRQLNESGIASDVTTAEKRVHLRLRGDFDPLMRVISEAYVVSVQVQEPTLEEIFLAYYSDDGEGR